MELVKINIDNFKELLKSHLTILQIYGILSKQGVHREKTTVHPMDGMDPNSSNRVGKITRREIYEHEEIIGAGIGGSDGV